MNLIGEASQLVEVLSEQLQRILAFHAGHRFFDVVLNGLRKIEVDAGVAGEVLLNGADQFIFVFVELGTPLCGRFKVGQELGIVEGADVGAVVRASHLRDHLSNLRIAAQDSANAIGDIRRLLEGDVLLHGGADPEIALFQRRHELAANEFEEDEGCDQRADPDGPGDFAVAQGILQ